MKLTDEEKRMLDGENGTGTAKAMDMVGTSLVLWEIFHHFQYNLI